MSPKESTTNLLFTVFSILMCVGLSSPILIPQPEERVKLEGRGKTNQEASVKNLMLQSRKLRLKGVKIIVQHLAANQGQNCSNL